MNATYKNITNLELQDLLENQDITLIDVRPPAIYSRGHIGEAINIPLEDLDTYNGDKEEVHYIICHQGVRSMQAAELLSSKGYKVVNVAEGMSAWQGEKIED